MKLTLKRLIRHKFAVLALLASSSVIHATDVTTDITSDTTWSLANSPYVLKDYIFVVSPATLTIEAGVVVQADEGSGTAAPALVVTQGAKISAIGTATKPITFTSKLDNPVGTLTKNDKGKWGGLIILGNAPINSNGSNTNTDPMTNAIEGIPTTSGISNRAIPASYAQYGGNVAADNSGTLKYVSIRHGGAEIGAGNEINGLTLGGVGSGTTIEYIDVFANKDDGIEFFGGSVNAKYLSVAYVGDDSFDFDEGYNGTLQFLLSVQDYKSNRAIEWDGSTESDDLGVTTNGTTPWSDVRIANMTAIGAGMNTTSAHEDNNVGLEIRDNAAGEVYNSIFVEMSKSIMDIEATGSSKGTVSNTDASIYGSQALLQNGTLEFKGNIFYNGGKGNTALGTAENDQTVADVIGLAGNSNTFDVDPLLLDTSSRDGVVAPFPYNDANNTSPALTAGVTLPGSIFEAAAYKGAFASSAASDNWLAGWSSIGGDSASAGSTPILAVDLNGSSSGTSSDSVFFGLALRGYVGDSPIAGGITISGTANKKILIRVKGPSMNFSGALMADPKITITKLNPSTNAYDPYLTVDNWGDHADTASNYSDRATSNTAEPVAVVEVAPGTYGVRVESATSGGTGNVNVEFYEVND